MRFLPCLAIASFLFLGGPACSPSDPAVETTSAEAPLSLEPAFLDLGSVTFGERSSGVWRMKNITGAPLMISRIGPFSCQCVQAELELPSRSGTMAHRRLDGKRLNLTLAEDEEMVIHFTLDTSRYRIPASRKIGSVPVVFPKYSGMILQWAADIWNPFSVEPWNVELGDIGVRQGASGTALVVSHDTQEFGIEDDFVTNEGWSIQSQEISVAGAGKTYQLTFTAPDVLPEGSFQKHFVVHTNLSGAPPIKVAVTGYARPDLSFSPSRLVFDPSRDRLEAKITVTHRAKVGDLSGLSFDTWLEADIEVVEVYDVNPKKRIFTLRYTGSATEMGAAFKLALPTGDKDTPVLQVPISIMPSRNNS
ncbi:MAG: hypothetical protein QM477_03775 [Planctomycetota bacterium]